MEQIYVPVYYVDSCNVHHVTSEHHQNEQSCNTYLWPAPNDYNVMYFFIFALALLLHLCTNHRTPQDTTLIAICGVRQRMACGALGYTSLYAFALPDTLQM